MFVCVLIHQSITTRTFCFMQLSDALASSASGSAVTDVTVTGTGPIGAHSTVPLFVNHAQAGAVNTDPPVSVVQPAAVNASVTTDNGKQVLDIYYV